MSSCQKRCIGLDRSKISLAYFETKMITINLEQLFTVSLDLTSGNEESEASCSHSSSRKRQSRTKQTDLDHSSIMANKANMRIAIYK